MFAEPAPPLGGGLGCWGCMLVLPAAPVMAPGDPPAPGVGFTAPTCPVPVLLPVLLPGLLPSCTPFELLSDVDVPLPVAFGTEPFDPLAFDEPLGLADPRPLGPPYASI